MNAGLSKVWKGRPSAGAGGDMTDYVRYPWDGPGDAAEREHRRVVEQWAAIDNLGIEARIDWLKRRCDWFTLANVLDEDAPAGWSWEVVGIEEIDDHGEQVFSGRGRTVGEAVAHAMRGMLMDGP